MQYRNKGGDGNDQIKKTEKLTTQSVFKRPAVGTRGERGADRRNMKKLRNRQVPPRLALCFKCEMPPQAHVFEYLVILLNSWWYYGEVGHLLEGGIDSDPVMVTAQPKFQSWISVPWSIKM